MKKKENEFGVDKEKKYKKISTIVVIVIVVIGLLVSSDIMFVTKFHKGPFFAIRTKVYKDGGTKEYYGLFYKVIKYHQVVGRRDMVIGGWNLKYSTNPLEITSMDLALEFRNYPKETYKKLYGQFLKITGNVLSVDKENGIITNRNIDKDGGKYKLDIECHMVETDGLDVTSDPIEIIGVLKDYKAKSGEKPAKVVIENCFK